MHSKQLGSLIIFHRKRAGLSQADLAKHANVSRYVVQNLESGTGKTTWKSLEAVLVVLNLRLVPEGPLVDEWRRSLKQDHEQKDK